MSEHTPGPWVPSAGGWIQRMPADGARPIARMVYHNEADQRLIAAAPDLLKVAEMALRYIEGEDVDLSLQAMADTIAKARGEA